MQQQTETALEENKKNIPLLVAFCPVAFCPVLTALSRLKSCQSV